VKRQFLPAIVILLLVAAGAAAADYYVDSRHGDDANPGTSPEKPWKTLARVGRAKLQPADSVLLKRGCAWREELMPPAPGTKDKPITFGAYGEGNRPLILGSVDKSGQGNWTKEGEGLWYCEGVAWQPNYFKLRQGMIWHDGVGGRQRYEKSKLESDWDWWIDSANKRAYVRLGHNPGRHRIEVQQRLGGNEAIVGFSGHSHITIRDLEIAFADIGIGIWQADGWVIENCDIHDVVVDCIHANGPEGDPPRAGVVRNCRLADWNWKGYKLTEHNYKEWGKSEPFMGYGVHVFRGDNWQVVGNTFRVVNNYSGMDCSPIAFDTGGHASLIADNDVDGANRVFGPTTGLMLWATKGDGPVVIRNNTFRNLGGLGIIVQEFKRFEFTHSVTVEGNKLINICTGDGIDAEALRVWTGYDKAAAVIVRNNIIYKVPKGSHEHPGIRVRASKAVVENNTIIGADYGVSVERGAQVTARNNISTGARKRACRVDESSKLTSAHNCWHGKVDGFEPSETDINADPKLGDAAAGDFAPATGSPCIDAGTPTGRTFKGAAPDIGAVEAG